MKKTLGEATRFVYGVGGQLIAEYDASAGALRKQNIYGPGGLLASVVPDAVAGAGARYVAADHLGSPRAVTNSGGAVSFLTGGARLCDLMAVRTDRRRPQVSEETFHREARAQLHLPVHLLLPHGPAPGGGPVTLRTTRRRRDALVKPREPFGREGRGRPRQRRP
ncbi:MAG: hypothetical protein M3416_17590 [Acidobacteriota bacterium]|nr:hypothetical protein [Acidobacteriota bacterium]